MDHPFADNHVNMLHRKLDVLDFALNHSERSAMSLLHPGWQRDTRDLLSETVLHNVLPSLSGQSACFDGVHVLGSGFSSEHWIQISEIA